VFAFYDLLAHHNNLIVYSIFDCRMNVLAELSCPSFVAGLSCGIVSSVLLYKLINNNKNQVDEVRVH
jgi:hypothetical protein